MSKAPFLVFILASIVLSCTSLLIAPNGSGSLQRAGVRYSHSEGVSLAKWGVYMMPATLEKSKTQVAGPAVLDRPETQRKEKVDDPVKEKRRQGGDSWEVRIYNDGINTREHVARSLVQVTGMSELSAYQTMMQAHQNGIAAVGQWAFEVAEMYHDALQHNGIVCDIVPVDLSE